VPGIGKVLCRSLTQEEAGHVRALALDKDPEQRFRIAGYVVSRCVLQVDGSRMFTNEEADKLCASSDSEALSALALAIEKLSKIKPEDVKAEGEPSAATTGLASS